jgi:organic hydroperoxide reductase OsmC/OhrA
MLSEQRHQWKILKIKDPFPSSFPRVNNTKGKKTDRKTKQKKDQDQDQRFISPPSRSRREVPGQNPNDFLAFCL